MDDSPEKIAEELHKWLRRLTFATIALYVILFSAGAVAFYISWLDRAELRKHERNTTHALCALRHDLVVRSKATTAFLRDHPKGIPGIPVASIASSLANQQATIQSLSTLICPPDL